MQWTAVQLSQPTRSELGLGLAIDRLLERGARLERLAHSEVEHDLLRAAGNLREGPQHNKTQS